MELAQGIKELVVQDVKRRIAEESIPRIQKCIHLLTDDQIWRKPNKHSNSIGNLILHLEGNVRQWLLSGIFKAKDDRDRDLEFSFNGPTPKQYLDKKLEQLAMETMEALNEITAEMLMESRSVQGFNETVTSILIHVTEHFSYHTGQIAFYTKLLINDDLGFYADFDLNEKSE